MSRTMQATPKRLLLKELIGQCTPMNEREWAAAEEIVRLQDQVMELQEQSIDLFEALEAILDVEPDPQNMGRFHDIANAAIAKARGEE